MFCHQCEQTLKGVVCTSVGVCGKSPEAAALQDLIMHQMVRLSLWALEGRKLGITDVSIDDYAMKAIFHTVTNVDFDTDSLAAVVWGLEERTVALTRMVMATGGLVAPTDPACRFVAQRTVPELVAQGAEVGLFSNRSDDADVRALMETTIYGVKGIASYADHAAVLGMRDPEIAAFVYKAFASLSDRSLAVSQWVGLALEAGKVNLRTMELLDEANTGTYGHPVPTEVPLGHRPNKAILISGHDLHDLDELLKQTEGLGIDVYTHGEMLPAHGYPGLKKHAHFFGHYGTAWQNQRKEFDAFPGAILMTTNCIQAPRDSYLGNIFTTGNVQWPGATHVEPGDFAAVIARAQVLPGFTDSVDGGSVLVGFGREAVLAVAPQVIEAVKTGAIKHFFLVGGCDGAKPGRSYYSDFVDATPDDTVVLTLACGKFRFFDHKLGDIGGIPRLLDIGQCNDAYSAIRIALALSDAFEVGVNDLPLTIVLSWYEQKAVAVLLTLLHLGIKDIRIGPSLPAFITPNVLQVLVDTFNLTPIGESAQDDLAAMLAPSVA